MVPIEDSSYDSGPSDELLYLTAEKEMLDTEDAVDPAGEDSDEVPKWKLEREAFIKAMRVT